MDTGKTIVDARQNLSEHFDRSQEIGDGIKSI